MRKEIGRLCLVLVIALGLAWWGGREALSAPPEGEGVIGQPWPGEGDFVPGQILVKPRAEMMAWQMGSDLGVQTVGAIAPLGVQIVSLSIAQGVDPYEATLEMLARYQADPRVEWAELDYIAQAMGEPNDPRFGQQWALAKISAPQAWDLTTGSPGVTIAILDTGVDLYHEDLQGKLVPGYDFVNGDSDPLDDHDHGTQVAGIAAAATNNGRGVAGVGYDCTIMPIKVLDRSGIGFYDRVAQGIIYATNQGAKVINMSLGGYASSNTLRDAVDYAWNHGVLLVAAVGNEDTSTPSYPAAYEHVMGVSCTDRNDQRSCRSNYGFQVSVAAPGVDILSTARGGGYELWIGTSMASPHVAGLASLLFAQDGSRTNATVREIIESTADDLGTPGWDPTFGYGRINAYSALSYSGQPLPPPPPPTPTVPAPTPTPASGLEYQVIELINQERAERGLVPLVIDERLMEAARRHSQDMATNDFFGHIGSDGSTPCDRMRAAGYPTVTCRETIAAASPNPSQIVAAWMNSPSHSTILLGSLHDIGVGYACNVDSTYHHYWTADFGTTSDQGQVPTPTPTSNQPTATPWPTATRTPWPTNTPTPRPTPTPYPSPTSTRWPGPSELEGQLVDLINQKRVEEGIAPLTIDGRLMEAAHSHSQDMATNDFFGHTGSDGSSPQDRMQAAGYPLGWGEEVLAANSGDPAVVLAAWTGSPHHHDILMDSAFVHIGVGYAYNSAAMYDHYWTVNVAYPNTVTPTPAPTSTPPSGSTTVTLVPAADAVGWVMNAEATGNRFSDDDMYTGIFSGWLYHGAVQFDLSSIPASAHVLHASVQLTGQTRSYMGDGGTWTLQLLSPDVDCDWPAHSFADIHNASVLYTVPPVLHNEDLGAGVVNTFTFEQAHLPALEDRLASTGKVSFRLDGPDSGSNNVFSWNSGYGTSDLGPSAKPKLQITYAP